MKPKASPLQIIDFALTKLEFRMLPPKGEDGDIMQYFREYELDIDFEILSGDYLQVIIKAEINKEKKLPGYAIVAEATCIFQFDAQPGLGEDIKRNLEGFSSVYIALNSLRGLISNFTANAPFGKYMLPSVDLNDLIEKKKLTYKAANKENKLPVKAATKKKERRENKKL